MKFVGKPPKLAIADWVKVDAPSDDLIVVGDGDPGFKIKLSKEQQRQIDELKQRRR